LFFVLSKSSQTFYTGMVNVMLESSVIIYKLKEKLGLPDELNISISIHFALNTIN